MKRNIIYLVLAILFVACKQEAIILEPKAQFSYSTSFDGFKVLFSNQSTNASNYNWDFGDGQTSTEPSPTHIYNSLGSFNVKLTVANEYKSISTIKTIIIKDTVSLNNASLSFNGHSIDVDGDNIVDFIISKYSYGINSNYRSSSIKPFNNYEIFSDSDTYYTFDYGLRKLDSSKVCVPKIYNIGAIIKNSDTTVNKEIIFCYHGNVAMSTAYYYCNWIKDEVRYVGFRKILDGKTKIGWLKLKVLDYTDITLYCFKIPHETESLLIDN